MVFQTETTTLFPYCWVLQTLVSESDSGCRKRREIKIQKKACIIYSVVVNYITSMASRSLELWQANLAGLKAFAETDFAKEISATARKREKEKKRKGEP